MGSENSSAIRYMAQNPAGRSAAGQADQGHHPGSRRGGEQQPRHGEHAPGSWANPELEKTGMGEQPEDACPARSHQGPAFGPAQGPDPMD